MKVPDSGPAGAGQGRRAVWLRAYVRFSRRYRFAIVLFSLALTALCAWYATGLRIDANLEALLPRNTPTIRAMGEAKQRLGSSDLFTIAIAIEDPAELARIQNRIADSLQKWPDVVYAQTARDNSFFRQHALMYLPLEQLKKIKN